MNETMPSSAAVKEAPVARSPVLPQTEQEKEIRANVGVRFLHWLVQRLPTVLIILLLIGLAWWGHHSSWKLPAFAELTGNHRESKADWCSEHGVPESQCVLCTPGLIAKQKKHGWCRAHGVYNCPLEHPDVVQLTRIPVITAEDRERAKRTLEFAKRPGNNDRCKLHPNLVQLASKEMAAKLGLDYDVVQRKEMEETVTANGEITYDKTKIASLASIVPGRVWRVEKQIGDRVKKGDVLALIDAVEVGKAKAAFLQALAEVDLRKLNVQRLKPLEGKAVAGAKILEEEAALRKAEAALVSTEQALNNLGIPVQAEQFQGLTPKQQNRQMQFLGLPKIITATLDPTTTTSNLIPIRASLDGIVVDRMVVTGETVDPSRSLFIIADTRTMWLKLYVRGEDARKIKLGQNVRFRQDNDDRPVTGTISWMSTSVDEKTRTLHVRADLANPDGRLRASTFGTGTILLRREKNAIVVPNSAIHWDGNCYIVFVQNKDYHKTGHPKVFHVRTIRPAAKTPQHTEIVAGVWPNEVVVTKGSGALRSQLLRNSLGAG